MEALHPNHVWQSDLTKVWAGPSVGWAYLVSVIDFSQVGAVADVQTGGVAYTAHVGGFMFGVISARIFENAGRTAESGTYVA